jgi:hypothetical protein
VVNGFRLVARWNRVLGPCCTRYRACNARGRRSVTLVYVRPVGFLSVIIICKEVAMCLENHVNEPVMYVIHEAGYYYDPV